jgi:hypothetical protein
MQDLKRHFSLGTVTVAWSALFAVVHLYWAAGGSIGMNGDPADTAAAQGYIAFIALLGIAGGAIAHAVDRGSAPGISRRTLVLLARAGGAALLVGVAVGTGRWLADGGVDSDGAAGLLITLYFLIGGVLFSALGRRPLRLPRAAS